MTGRRRAALKQGEAETAITVRVVGEHGKPRPVSLLARQLIRLLDLAPSLLAPDWAAHSSTEVPCHHRSHTSPERQR